MKLLLSLFKLTGLSVRLGLLRELQSRNPICTGLPRFYNASSASLAMARSSGEPDSDSALRRLRYSDQRGSSI